VSRVSHREGVSIPELLEAGDFLGCDTDQEVIDGGTWTPYIEIAEPSTNECPPESSMLGDLIKSWLWRRGSQKDEEIQELVNGGVLLIFHAWKPHHILAVAKRFSERRGDPRASEWGCPPDLPCLETSSYFGCGEEVLRKTRRSKS